MVVAAAAASDAGLEDMTLLEDEGAVRAWLLCHV